MILSPAGHPALAASRRALLAALEGLDEPAFSARLPDGGWSAGQVCEHLARVDESVMRRFERSRRDRETTAVTWLDRLRRAPLGIPALTAIRVRTFHSLDPANAPPRGPMLERLAAARSSLLDFAAALDPSERRTLTATHPIFGRFTVDGFLDYLAWHERRHARQAARIRSALARGTPPRG
jgi:uncharacterized damage-inducible protein DinB